ncbi:MAG: hypothetical protein JW795_05295 [Chitinivibrionales bacterium]|nr:hypothetical protein [Chitinivibrionales bacterium]
MKSKVLPQWISVILGVGCIMVASGQDATAPQTTTADSTAAAPAAAPASVAPATVESDSTPVAQPQAAPSDAEKQQSPQQPTSPPSAAADSAAVKVRIGIMNPLSTTGKADFATEAVVFIQQSLTDIAAYEVATQSVMASRLSKIGQKIPPYCRDPRCIAALGASLKLDRMIYGSVDKTEKSYGVVLTLLDVLSAQIVENVSLEGDAGVSLQPIIICAVKKLHGYSDQDLDTTIHVYFGKKVANIRQLAIASASTVGLGVAWALVNEYSAKGTAVAADYTRWKKAMCGIGTGADLAPLCSRPAALGNAYSAASDDSYGVFFNPAGLSWVGDPEISVNYQSRFGLNTFTGSYANKATREIGFGEGIIYTSDDDGLLSEVYCVSSISYKFNQLIPQLLRPLSLGASLKVQSKRAGSKTASPSSISGSASGAGLNLGAQLELSEQIRGSILFKNLPSYMRWNNKSTGKKYFEAEPVELYWGGSFQANYETFLVCDFRIPLYTAQQWHFMGGVERTLYRFFKLRAGAEKITGLTSPWKINGGLGLFIPTESILGKYCICDVAYEYNTLRSFANVMNVSMRFGF